jgi:hypothetical protein
MKEDVIIWIQHTWRELERNPEICFNFITKRNNSKVFGVDEKIILNWILFGTVSKPAVSTNQLLVQRELEAVSLRT